MIVQHSIRSRGITFMYCLHIQTKRTQGSHCKFVDKHIKIMIQNFGTEIWKPCGTILSSVAEPEPEPEPPEPYNFDPRKTGTVSLL
jgi:hypothetical protein